MNREHVPTPPIARKVPKELVTHGEARVDNYFWLRDRANPGVIEYIEAENRYADEATKHTEPLKKKLIEELKSRMIETDISVPQKKDDYYYYTRSERGKQYPIHCRKKGTLNAEEEVILDENDIAKESVFFTVNMHKVSPDHQMLAYLADTNGSERNTLYVKDLGTEELLSEQIPNTSEMEWANDNKTIFYSIMDNAARAYKVFRHVLGTNPKADVEVFHEEDPGFYYLVLSKTKTRKYILITVESATTSEVHYIRADRPKDGFKVMRARKHRVVYFAIHHEDRFFIVTNENAINFKIMEAPESDPAAKNWKEFVPHREGVSIDVSDPYPFVEAFNGHLVIFERENGQGRIRVLNLKDKRSHYIDFPEEIFMAYPIENPDPESEELWIKYFSMVTPDTIYAYDLKAKKLELKKQDKFSGYDPLMYHQERVFAKARDGKNVLITLVHRKDLKKEGRNPTYLYGYGAYGTFEWATYNTFNSMLIPLLERGFVCAHAHIRGGGELGRRWHEDGRMLKKINTFTDFIACAEHLIAERYTSTDRLTIRGRSAGGLLMGAVTNMRPDLFKVVVAEVPFVDAVTTMLDPSIPQTVGEFEEWGNPALKQEYDYIKTYSPYDNIERKPYPNMLITASLNDIRVPYWEPVKWTAKLRAMKTDYNTILLKTGIVEGHSGASGRYDHLKYFAYMYAFILDR
ncbi:MAG: S9 family peptidase, partial [Thermoplasmata archaeon]|nr:S9 family peptidase [Thermoplasmata archaeon]